MKASASALVVLVATGIAAPEARGEPVSTGRPISAGGPVSPTPPPSSAPLASATVDSELASLFQASYLGAQRLLEHGQYAEAKWLLKPQVEAYPESRELAVLLAAAYLGEKNPFWAIRMLAPRQELSPDDCELRLWLAWAYVDIGEPERSLELLEHRSCRQAGPLAGRASLMRAMVADARGQRDTARTELDRARAEEDLYSSDVDALPVLSRKLDPDRIPELSWRLDAREGYTSNALLGSPTDPQGGVNQANSSADSVFYQLSGWIRYSPNWGALLRPAIELEARVFQLADSDLRQQSYVNPTARIGSFVGRRLPRVFVGYRPDYLQLAGGDPYRSGPYWYMGGHRAEFELEYAPWLMAFGGAGRRDFRLMARSRYEADGGLGGELRLIPRLAAIWAASARKHWADHGAYDLRGFTGFAKLNYDLPGGWQPRITVTVARDRYPHSAGYFSGGARRDVLAKVGVALWSSELGGWRAGWSYDYSRRTSTASLYEFDDHRVSMMVAWSGSTEVTGVPRAAPAPVPNMDWGLEAGATEGLQERVQDYLREDERTLQRACGCHE